jgi:outer membrane receptor protein involved in Fe transport
MRCACTAFALFLAAAATAVAQANTAPRGPLFLLASAGPARAPVVVEAGSVAALRRRVRLSLEGVELTDALAQIARAAGLQIVFADGVVPVTPRVHLKAEEITVAAALTDVLLDARVDVVLLPGGSVVLVKRGTWATGSVAGRVTDARTGHGVPGARVSLQGTSLGTVTNDSGGFRIANVPPGNYTVTVRRIGYVQAERAIVVTADREIVADVRLDVSATPLDAVVVTGTITATEQKELPNPITIVTAGDIQRRAITQVNQLFRGEIPGVFTADYGDAGPFIGAPVYVRGASALFDLPVLKTYLDGVELANSNFINEIDPTMIDHIEIIRGPEASTLYGAQAINGVMQIFTKKGHLGAPLRLVTSFGAGTLEGLYKTGVRLDDNVSLTGGTSDLSYNVGLRMQRDGAWTPDYYLNVYSGYGALAIRPAGSPVSVDVTARLGQQDSRSSATQSTARAMLDGTLRLNPIQAMPYHTVSSLPQLTLGVTAHYAARTNWQHTLTVGIDRGGNGTDYVQPPTFVTPADTLTTVFSTETTRLTAAYNSAFDWRLSDRLAANVVVGADRWDYQSNSFDTYGSTTDVGELGQASVSLARERDHNTGVFGQARMGLADALFLTAGVRVDEGPDLPADRHHRFTAPRVGASYAFALGPVRGKLRAGYGSALKPAYPGYKRAAQFSPTYVQVGNPNLLPERQTGWDAGVELYSVDRASLSATYYRQLARDLIAIAFLAFDPVFTQQFQNVARVRNNGWELEGSLQLGLGLTARATYSIVESTVDSLGPADQTGYHVGDALLGVPHHTGALTISERTERLSAEAGISYVGTSFNYDPLAWTHRAFTRLGAPSYDNPIVTLPATYRLGLRVGYDVTPRLSLFANCENLTNRIVTDFGNYPVNQIGRATIVGVRLH